MPPTQGSHDRDEADASAVLSISLIGPVRVSIDGRELPLHSDMVRALIAILALSDRFRATREQLWHLLWGDADTRKAQDSLRQIVQRLRKLLQPTDFTDYRFAPDALSLGIASIRVDIREVLDATSDHTAHPLLLDHREITEVLASGLDHLDPAFVDWLHTQRNAIQRRLQRDLEEGLARADLPTRQRRDLAEALSRLNPTHEDAVRELMRLLARAGNAIAAQQAYLDLSAALDTRYDALPDEATTTLYAEIKAGLHDPPPAISPSDSVPAAVAGMAEAPPRPFDPPADQGGTQPPDRPSLAILPFVAAGSPSVPEYLGTGLVEDMIAAIATLDDVSVISRTSTLDFLNRPTDIRRAGRELGVRYVLSGTLRRLDGRLRVAVEVADASTGTVQWGLTRTVDDADMFAMQDEIVASVVGLIAPRIHTAELQRVRRKRPENLTAYDHMLQGVDLMYRLQPARFDEAMDHLRRAMALDPLYAMPVAHAAEWHSLRIGQGWSTDRPHDQCEAIRLSRAALELDPDNVHALTGLAHDTAFIMRDFNTAMAMFDRAAILAPGSARVWGMSGPTWCYVGEAAEAVRRTRRAKELSPLDLYSYRLNATLLLAHYTAGEYREAVHWGGIALGQNNRYTATLRYLAASHAALGDSEAARGMAARLLALEPDFTVSAYRHKCPFRDPDRIDATCHHLREAGLPA